LVLPGELAKHAVSEGTKAVTKYQSTKDEKEEEEKKEEEKKEEEKKEEEPETKASSD